MKSQTLLIIVLGAVAFLAYRQFAQPALPPQNPTNNPTGGAQQQAPTDLFGSILGIVQGILQTANTVVAQTSSKPV